MEEEVVLLTLDERLRERVTPKPNGPLLATILMHPSIYLAPPLNGRVNWIDLLRLTPLAGASLGASSDPHQTATLLITTWEGRPDVTDLLPYYLVAPEGEDDDARVAREAVNNQNKALLAMALTELTWDGKAFITAETNAAAQAAHPIAAAAPVAPAPRSTDTATAHELRKAKDAADVAGQRKVFGTLYGGEPSPDRHMRSDRNQELYRHMANNDWSIAGDGESFAPHKCHAQVGPP